MRQRSFIVVAIALAILVLGAVGVYAFDKTRDDVIAEGVKAGGVDLSGMSPDEARLALKQQLAAPLRKPVVVRYAGHRYKMTAHRARVSVDTNGMVDQALDQSRKDNLISRTTRAITGGKVHANIPVEITYSQKAVAHFAEN